MKVPTPIFLATISSFFIVHCSFAFEGRITVTVAKGNESQSLLYTVGTNFLRIDCLETDRPYASDILDTSSSQMTLVFHHNRSFVRFPLTEQNASGPPGFPSMPPNFPQIPSASPGAMPGAGPANLPGMPPSQMSQMPNMPAMPPALPPGIGPQSGPGARGMAMPMMPPMLQQQVVLQNTGETTNILGYCCAHYKIQSHDETMDIWATDQLPPFQAYLQIQPIHRGPRRLEDQWGGALKDRKLFPLLASLKFRNGFEMLRFEVTGIQPEKIKDGSLSQPPPAYNEMQPLPF